MLIMLLVKLMKMLMVLLAIAVVGAGRAIGDNDAVDDVGAVLGDIIDDASLRVDDLARQMPIAAWSSSRGPSNCLI